MHNLAPIRAFRILQNWLKWPQMTFCVKFWPVKVLTVINKPQRNTQHSLWSIVLFLLSLKGIWTESTFRTIKNTCMWKIESVEIFFLDFLFGIFQSLFKFKSFESKLFNYSDSEHWCGFLFRLVDILWTGLDASWIPNMVKKWLVRWQIIAV